MKFKKITVCLDMRGCPNRCKHCWLGNTPNGCLTEKDLRDVAESFRPYAEKLEVYDWYREPDFAENYKEMWALCNALSDEHAPHFELVSFWRLARDGDYAKWLAELGVKYAQLTLFGGEEMTDYFVGRRGAYREILRSIDLLLDHGICPRIQTFINACNIGHLGQIEKLIGGMELEKRCRDVGGEFSFFLHAGSCDGENEQFYGARVTADLLSEIPAKLAELTLKHFGKKRIAEVFGFSERRLYEELSEDHSVKRIVSDEPVFYVDKDFNVFPNYTAPSDSWRIGNMRDGMEKILSDYLNDASPAQRVFANIPVSRIVRKCGAKDGMGLFSRGDYRTYLVNRFCREFSA